MLHVVGLLEYKLVDGIGLGLVLVSYYSRPSSRAHIVPEYPRTVTWQLLEIKISGPTRVRVRSSHLHLMHRLAHLESLVVGWGSDVKSAACRLQPTTLT